jgi:hypothetical protein
MKIKKRITRTLIKELPHTFPQKLSMELRSFNGKKPTHFTIHYDHLNGYIEGNFKEAPTFDWLRDAQLAIKAFAHLSI